MKNCIREIMERCGQTVTIRNGETTQTAQAFLQPVTKQGEQMPDSMCGIGALDGRLWLYLGQAEVRPGDNILWNGQTFRVRSNREYHLGETSLYWWASLETEREAAE